MSGLLRRLRRRRPATADETRVATPASSEPAGAPAETPAEPGGDQPVPAADDQPTEMLPRTADQPPVAAEPVAAPQPAGTPETVVAPSRAVARDLPAGVDPGQLELGPAPSARRGKLRRRLRYLRRVRELLLRDLGGFTYEIHRTVGETPRESHRRLAASKAERIAALDVEVRGLESRLSEPHAEPLIREPGIGGTCPECGELHASDARYCSRCGMPLDAKARALRDAAIAAAAAAHPTTGSHAVTEPGPASVLWAAGPRPRAHSEPVGSGTAEPEAPRPASVTSQWLARPDHATVMGQPAEGAEPAADEPAAATPPPADEPGAAAADEPAGAKDEPAVKEAEAAPVEDETADDAEKRADFDATPNGRRDEDVQPPVPSGDPLPSRAEELP